MINCPEKDWLALIASARAHGIDLPQGVIDAEVDRWVRSGSGEALRSVARRLGCGVATVYRSRDRNTNGTPGTALEPTIERSRNTSGTPAQISTQFERNTNGTPGPQQTPDIERSRNTREKSNINVSFNSDIRASQSLEVVGAGAPCAFGEGLTLFGGAVAVVEPIGQSEIDRLSVLFCRLSGRKKLLKLTRKGIEARLKTDGFEAVEAVILWLFSDHDRAEYIRSNGYHLEETPWRPGNFEKYLDMSRRPRAERPMSDLQMLELMMREEMEKEQ